MQGNDDIIFRTNGWDALVEQAFENCPDKILLVHGSDEGQHFTRFGAHGIVHRRWIDTVGYFIPPYFSSDYGDAWINELAEGIRRRKFVPFIAEHMHFMFGKAPMDQTTRERLARHKRDNVDDIWRRTKSERIVATKKLAALIGVKYIPPLPLQASLPKPEEQPIRRVQNARTNTHQNVRMDLGANDAGSSSKREHNRRRAERIGMRGPVTYGVAHLPSARLNGHLKLRGGNILLSRIIPRFAQFARWRGKKRFRNWMRHRYEYAFICEGWSLRNGD